MIDGGIRRALCAWIIGPGRGLVVPIVSCVDRTVVAGLFNDGLRARVSSAGGRGLDGRRR